MTREEMRTRASDMLADLRLGEIGCDEAAAAVIRLVVEACAAEMPAFQAHYLRSTFLPPEAREQCKHEWTRPLGNVGLVCQHCGALGPMTD